MNCCMGLSLKKKRLPLDQRLIRDILYVTDGMQLSWNHPRTNAFKEASERSRPSNYGHFFWTTCIY